MPEVSVLLLAACMFFGAALYTSVGHAGASAYIALMALFGIPPAVMRPTALALNILVSAFTSFRFVDAGLFRWRTLWPFLVGAIPFAALGGSLHLPGAYYRPLVGTVLYSAVRGCCGRVSLSPASICAIRRSGLACFVGLASAFSPASPGLAAASFFPHFCFSSDGPIHVPLRASLPSSSSAIRLPVCLETWL